MVAVMMCFKYTDVMNFRICIVVMLISGEGTAMCGGYWGQMTCNSGGLVYAVINNSDVNYLKWVK